MKTLHRLLGNGFAIASLLKVAAMILLVLCLLTPLANGLILVGKGNEPVADNNWPAGSLAVANLKIRLGWWEGPPFGGGQHNFLYHGNEKDFQAALDLFAKINAPKLELVVRDGGAGESGFLKDDKDPKGDNHFSFSFTIWNPVSWNALYNNPQSHFSAEDPNGGLHQFVPPPTLAVFTGQPGGIDFSKIKVPGNVHVTDERADVAGFAGGSAVVGDVYDIITSKPIENAKITLSIAKAADEWTESASTNSAANGHFELKAAPKGYFGVIATADGFAPRMLTYVELRGNTLKRFTVHLSPAHTLAGTALDTAGKPVTGATVRADSVTTVDDTGYISPVRRQIKTDDKGHFELSGLPQGHTTLFAYGDHYLALDIMKLHSIPEENLTIRLTMTGAIKGRVLDTAGKPAVHGNVDVEPPGERRDRIGKWGGSSNTEADGSFHFENVPPGEYVVTGMGTNPGPAPSPKDPKPKTITVKPGKTTEVNVTGR